MSVIFWDFDGTLVHSNSLWSRSVYTALQETDANAQVEFEEIRKHMKYGFTWHTPEQDYSNMTGDKWWDFMNAHIYESYIKCGVSEEIAQAATAKMCAIIKRVENYELYEDTLDTLRTAKELGYTNVILSNNYPDMDEVVEKLGLMKYLDGMIVSAVEGYDKPRKELFEVAKAKFPSDEYYMVGDNIKADIFGGNNAGMKTIYVHRDYSEEADYCFDDLSSIGELLKSKQMINAR